MDWSVGGSVTFIDIIDDGKDKLITTAELNCAPHAAFDLLVINGYGKFAKEVYADPDIFDTDGDGCSNEAEINDKVPKAFSCGMLDANNDGRIDRREYEYAFDVLDIDSNVNVSWAELNCASHAAFNLLDKDNNGTPTRMKFMAGLPILYRQRWRLLARIPGQDHDVKLRGLSRQVSSIFCRRR